MKALAFSGGKDSWACLWLHKDELEHLPVLWVDTGKNFPEMLETIEKAKALCPKFVTIKSDRDANNKTYGLPADLVPVDNTLLGQMCVGKQEITVQSYLECCYNNIAVKITEYCHANGITELINGQRAEENRKSTSVNGDVVFGIKRIQPIENWSEEYLFEFLAKHMEIPDHFRFKHSSMDCYDCTAYKKDTKDIQEYRRINWPELENKYLSRKKLLDTAIDKLS